MNSSESAPASQAGFTLIEVLVVALVLGILAGIATPSLIRQGRNGYQAAMFNDLRNAAGAEESYAAEHDGAYNAGVFSPTTNGSSADDLAGGGLRVSPNNSVTATVDAMNPGKYCLRVDTSVPAIAAYHLYYENAGAGAGRASSSEPSDWCS